MRTKSPVLKSYPAEESESPDSPREQGSFLVRQRKMQQGLLAKAAVYANNASKNTSTISQFNGILTAKRDPIVWGDASNRYSCKKPTEINNNDHGHGKYEDQTMTQKNDEEFLAQRRNTQPKQSTLESDCFQANRTPTPNSLDFREAFSNQDDIGLHPNSSSRLEVGLSTVINESSELGCICPPPVSQDRYKNNLSFDTTQQLRSGFFRSIKRQYSPILAPKTDSSAENGHKTAVDSQGSDSTETDGVEGEGPTEEYTMSKLARQKLEQFRKRGLKNIDVPTGLQWIRLELHEMREQDKSLFLQLIKLHSTIKDLRADMSGADDFDSYDDLHSAASLWWPRRGHSFNALPDFSSSDGARLFRGGKAKTPLRRGFSLNYPPVASPPRCSPVTSLHETSLPPSGNDSEISLNMMGVTAI